MITIKTQEEIQIIREGGKILATTIKELEKLAKPGVTTLELDRAAEALILSAGAKPAFKGYEGFPFALCASVNENIVHGYPSNYVLKEGDIIVSLDNIELNEDNDLADIVQNYSAGETISLIVSRQGQEKEVKATLTELK